MGRKTEHRLDLKASRGHAGRASKDFLLGWDFDEASPKKPMTTPFPADVLAAIAESTGAIVLKQYEAFPLAIVRIDTNSVTRLKALVRQYRGLLTSHEKKDEGFAMRTYSI